MKFKNGLGLLIAILLVVNQFFVNPIFAQEFSVTGNGEGSSNNISYTDQTDNTVSQNNSADIDNNLEVEANTGDNQANANSGEVEIVTGDVIEGVTILNSGNSSIAEVGCCVSDDPSTASIDENGDESDNSIYLSDHSSNKVTIINDLALKNNVSISANTGDNEADDNDGDVTIQTGGINLFAQILNLNLNNAKISAFGQSPLFKYSISGNGAGSSNLINEESSEDNEYFVFNALNLVNNISSYSNTGGNKANKNSGKVFIWTGSIILDIILQNKDINGSKIIENCCSKVLPSPSPSPSGSPSPSELPSPNPSSPPGSSCCSPTNNPPGPGGGSGGPGSSGGGDVLGVSLPATGGFSLWTLTILTLLILAIGVILRSDYAFTKFHPKKAFGKFTDSFRSYIFGAYLFANINGIRPLKA